MKIPALLHVSFFFFFLGLNLPPVIFFSSKQID